jgi:hypothetical protein
MRRLRRRPPVDDRHIRLSYLGATCRMCGRDVSGTEQEFGVSRGAYEFNHIDPARKAPDYENLIRRNLSSKQLDEIDKCNLLCGHCHPIWTFQRVTGKMRLTSALPNGRLATSKFSTHGFYKFKDDKPEFHLYSDEIRHVGSYAYRLGNGGRVFKTGDELERILDTLLLATRKRGFLRIADERGDVFETQRINQHKFKMQMHVRFPLIKFEGRDDENGEPFIWVRNAKAIIKGVGVRTNGVVTIEALYSALEDGIGRKRAAHPA